MASPRAAILTTRMITGIIALVVGCVLSSCTQGASASKSSDEPKPSPMTAFSRYLVTPITCSSLELVSVQGIRDEVCRLTSDEGPYSFIVSNAAETESVVLLDPGGPYVDESDADSLFAEMYPLFDDSVQVVLAYLSNPNESTPACRNASDESFAEECDARQIVDLHTRQFHEAVVDVLRNRGSGNRDGVYFDVVGSGFAAARWAWIGANSAGLGGPRFISVADPLKFDIPLDFVRMARAEVGIEQHERVLNACDPSGPCPATGGVALVERIHDVTGRPRAEITDGLAGMLPTISVNGPAFRDAVNNADADFVVEYIEAGISQLRGRNVFDERSERYVHNTAAACAVLGRPEQGRTEQDGETLNRWLSECDSFPDDLRLDVQDRMNTSSRVCFLPSSPDPILGWAGEMGSNYGLTVDSVTLVRDEVSHGHLRSAWVAVAEALPSTLNLPGKVCGGEQFEEELKASSPK